MSIDKKINYKDKKLTKAQQKKIKPANQGGGPNYLGKQKTVTVPKKWLSSPDHVVAELAYITPREQKILLDANLYGSLKGKPNRGPDGIMSLQGDMGSVGGGNSGNSGNGGNNDYGRPSMADIAGPVSTAPSSSNNNDDDSGSSDDYGYGVTGPETKDPDSNREDYRTGQYTTGPKTKDKNPETKDKDPDKTTIDKLKTITFAPKDSPFTLGNIWEGIKTIGTTAVKGLIATQTFGLLGLSPKAVSIGNVALGLGKQTGLTKSGSLGELGKNTLGSIGDVFSGNTNSLSGNTNSLSGNTNNSLSNNQNNGGERDQGNADQGDVLASEYILLLQKMQLGNFTQEDQTRFNLLKTMLGK